MSMPVVFLHGWGLHGGVWDGIDLPGFQCLFPDLPGYGDSPAPVPYRAEALADAMSSQWAMSAPFVLVGWSLGGLVAQAWATRYPEQVRVLVLVDSTPAFVSRPDWPYGLPAERLAELAADLLEDRRATLLRFLSLQGRGGDAAREVVGRLRSSLLARPEPAADVLQGGLELLRDEDLRPSVGSIRCPTLVLHGGRDYLCPAAAGAWLAAHIPVARLAVHDRAAHAPFLSHPDWFGAQLQAFLNEVGT